jgi:hypothetical protein
MKQIAQIAQNNKSGELTVLAVPAPACRPGSILVQSLFSLISIGTGVMKVAEARMSMVGKAWARDSSKSWDVLSLAGGRRAALIDLAAQLPAAVLADLLGLHPTTAVKWMHQAGADWNRYAAELARARPRSLRPRLRHRCHVRMKSLYQMSPPPG